MDEIDENSIVITPIQYSREESIKIYMETLGLSESSAIDMYESLLIPMDEDDRKIFSNIRNIGKQHEKYLRDNDNEIN